MLLLLLHQITAGRDINVALCVCVWALYCNTSLLYPRAPDMSEQTTRMNQRCGVCEIECEVWTMLLCDILCHNTQKHTDTQTLSKFCTFGTYSLAIVSFAIYHPKLPLLIKACGKVLPSTASIFRAHQSPHWSSWTASKVVSFLWCMSFVCIDPVSLALLSSRND